jgi:hypothetical protein
VKGLAAFAAMLVALTSCGGESERHSGDSGGDEGGSTGTGGTTGTGGIAGTGVPTGGASPTGGAPPSGGTAGTGPPGSCNYAGQVWLNGESFASSDGCNTCYCHDGSVSCTLVDCPATPCESLTDAYAEALADAKRCNPDVEFVFPCMVPAVSGLRCGCPTFVNDATELDELVTSWNELGCDGGGVVCGACAGEPVTGTCSAERVCMDVYE